jgi:hypothetical protein
LVEVDDQARSSSGVEEDLSKLPNAAILIIEAVWESLEWDLEAQQLVLWLEDFLELKILPTRIIWVQEELET